MDIVDIVRHTNRPVIGIPYYHRALISLMPGSAYTAVLLRGDTLEPDNDNFLIPQILITPFPFEDWEYLWRISCSLRERVGVVNDIVNVLEQASLNVLSEVSRAIHLNQYHNVELIVSARQLVKERKKDYEATIHRMRETILVDFLDELLIEEAAGIRRSALTCEFMTRYAALHEQCLAESFPNPNPGRILTVQGDGNPIIIDIPQEWYESLAIRNEYQTEDAMAYFIHTNSRHQLMSIYFPHKTKTLCNVRIVHKDEIGAIASFTDEIRRAGITLISTVTRKQEDKINHFEFVCEQPGMSEQLLLDNLKAALCVAEVVRYEPIMQVPRKKNFSWSDWEQVWSWEECESGNGSVSNHKRMGQIHPPTASTDDKTRREKLERKYELLKQRQRSEPVNAARRRELEARIENAEGLLRNGLLAVPKVFVSYKMYRRGEQLFERTETLINRIKDLFGREGFEVLTGAGDQSEDLEGAIAAQIDRCPFFLGVLTADECEDLPSYWVIWEYGYARARCLEWKLMAEESVQIPSVIRMFAPGFRLPESADDTVAWERIDRLIKRFAEEFRKDWEDRIRNMAM